MRVIVRFELVASCIEWNDDKNGISCNAACEFFYQVLNTRRGHYTAKFVTLALSKLVKYVSFLSLQTKNGDHPYIALLLKAMLLCCSRDQLHQFQTILLQNGCFLTHLHRALVGSNPKRCVSKSGNSDGCGHRFCGWTKDTESNLP